LLTQLIHGPGFNKMVRGRYGYILYNRNDQYIGQAIEKYGEYQEEEVSLFRNICKPGDHVVDVGANIGTHALAMARIVGKHGHVYAFEPQSVVFQTMCANMALNSIDNATCGQYIVSDNSGHGFIPKADYNQFANYGGVQEADYGENGYSVPKITIDSLGDYIDFIKIDVEGMESKVILGAEKTIKECQPYLYVENDQLDKSEKLIKLIMGFGYTLYWHTPYLFNEHNYAGNKENIYNGIVSVNMLCVPKGKESPFPQSMVVNNSKFHPFKGA
jgi:FkbM family methyltransferase